MTTMRVTHMLSTGYLAVEIMPCILAIEGRGVQSIFSLDKLGVSVAPIDSDVTYDITDEQLARAR